MSLDMIAELSMRLPEGSQLAIGSRQDVPVPVARLRAQRGVVEIGIDDLAMDRPAARALLAGAGWSGCRILRSITSSAAPRAGRPVCTWRRWRSTPDLAPAVTSTFTGDDRFVADYLRSEFLDRVVPRRRVVPDAHVDPRPPDRAALRRRRRSHGSSGVLDRLERRNLLVLPLDRNGEWYRYHHLFRDLLARSCGGVSRRSSQSSTPEPPRGTRSTTCLEAAIEHAPALRRRRPGRSSGPRGRQPGLGQRSAATRCCAGWSGSRPTICSSTQPAVAVHGALIFALVGRPGDAERWAEAAERTTLTGVQADGNTMEGTLAYLRALLCRDGLDEMRKDAQTALDGLAPISPYRAAMLHADGSRRPPRGRPRPGRRALRPSDGRSHERRRRPVRPVALAERGLVAIEQGRLVGGRGARRPGARRS